MDLPSSFCWCFGKFPAAWHELTWNIQSVFPSSVWSRVTEDRVFSVCRVALTGADQTLSGRGRLSHSRALFQLGAAAPRQWTPNGCKPCCVAQFMIIRSYEQFFDFGVTLTLTPLLSLLSWVSDWFSESWKVVLDYCGFLGWRYGLTSFPMFLTVGKHLNVWRDAADGVRLKWCLTE